jgi:hypothetical protein
MNSCSSPIPSVSRRVDYSSVQSLQSDRNLGFVEIEGEMKDSMYWESQSPVEVNTLKVRKGWKMWSRRGIPGDAYID